MAGYLLARRGVPVTVLEKHSDFNRDFRGDTVHPSTLDVLYELGLLNKFLQIPHQEVRNVSGLFGGRQFTAASTERLPTHCRFVALMPQWDFLNFLSDEAKKYSSFDLRMNHEVVDLIRAGERVVGVLARRRDGETVPLRADLVIGCDGRHAIIRQKAQLPLVETGVPIDVLWFRLSRVQDDPDEVFGNVNYGSVLILINRGDYFQAGLIVRKGSLPDLKAKGLDAFREKVRLIAPYLGNRVDELQSWDEIKLLTVQINHLRRWYAPGLLCIGDAAHAMSPAFGVGINLAIHDAVATANILAEALRNGDAIDPLLAAVQRRRELPVRAMQFLQRLVHAGFNKVFQTDGPLTPPAAFRVITGVPGIQHVMGRIVGLGFRPEHVRRPRVSLLKKAAALMKGVSAAVQVVFARQPAYRSHAANRM